MNNQSQVLCYLINLLLLQRLFHFPFISFLLYFLRSSWTNALSYIIRTIRNIFYNFVNSDRDKDAIQKYFHDTDMQRLNIICFCFVQQLMEYIKDTNGIIIFEKAINKFVTATIVMSVELILLEVGNFIVITGKIVKTLKITHENFKLIEKFFFKLIKYINIPMYSILVL